MIGALAKFMKPNEAAKLANGLNQSNPIVKQIRDFLSAATAREILEFVHLLYPLNTGHPYYIFARISLDIRLAEDADKIADKLTKQTDRLVAETITLSRFTKGLFWFTVVIAIFALVQIAIMVLDYASKNNEGFKYGIEEKPIQTNQYQKN